MRISPISILSNRNNIAQNSIFFLSGNEITLIEKIKISIIEHFKNKGSFVIKKIKNIEECKFEKSLFEKNNIYIVNDIKGLTENKIEDLLNSNEIFIFINENSPKIKTIKSVFIKRKDTWLVDCYELSKEDKQELLRKYLAKNKISTENETYWELVESLADKYFFFEKELDKLECFSNSKINIEQIKTIVSKKIGGANDIFFEVLKNNSKITEIYNNKVTNSTELNEFFYSFKRFCFLIIDSENENDFKSSIPNYLFKQRSFLISLFNSFNNKKKTLLLNLLHKTERSIRSNDKMSIIIGLRFLMNFKRLVTS